MDQCWVGRVAFVRTVPSQTVEINTAVKIVRNSSISLALLIKEIGRPSWAARSGKVACSSDDKERNMSSAPLIRLSRDAFCPKLQSMNPFHDLDFSHGFRSRL